MQTRSKVYEVTLKESFNLISKINETGIKFTLIQASFTILVKISFAVKIDLSVWHPYDKVNRFLSV